MQTVDRPNIAASSNSDNGSDKIGASLIRLTTNSGSKPPNRCRFVVIGAGLAGLATAQRLHEQFQANYDDDLELVLLEAQDRVGGRVHTVRPREGHESTSFFELGAQWLHGADQNPLYNWLNSELKLLDDFENAKMAFQGAFCTQFGQLVEPQLVERVLSIVCDCKAALTRQLQQDQAESTNASQLFKCQLDELTKSDELLAANSELVLAIYDWFLRYETIENSCDSMDDVSTQSYTDWSDLGEGTLLNFKRGYSSLLDWFCSRIPTDKCLFLERQVLNIELLDRPAGSSSRKPISVRYRNLADGSLGCIECDHVVVTCSLGFLKKNHETLFTPRLPQIKRQLIESIGFGTVNKIVMQFERPFWRQGEGIKLVWLGASREEPAKPTGLPAWTRDIIAFDSVRKQPNVLIGWIGGLGAKQMESESDERVGEICLQLLDRFLPENDTKHERPTRLLSCVCSRWTRNEFVCGSYSFQSMKSFGSQVDQLHEPICGLEWTPSRGKRDSPRVLFAGEATAGELYSTTHGAIISGWREANRLVEHYSLEKLQKRRLQDINSIRMSSLLEVNSKTNGGTNTSGATNGGGSPFGSCLSGSMQAC